MPSHPETEAAFRDGLATGHCPPGLRAVGDLERRFSVYRNTVAHSLTEALTQRFPTVLRLVGPDFFRAMAQVFIAKVPPRTPVLHAYGDAFPAFLATFPPAAGLPYLPDVARIEVLRGEAYHAADAGPLPVEAVTRAFARDAEGIGLTLHPSVRLMTSDHPAVSIWAVNQGTGQPAAPPPDPEAALIFRKGGDVLVLRLPQASFRILQSLRDGATLGAACAAFDPQIAGEAVSTLLKHGLITGLSHP